MNRLREANLGLRQIRRLGVGRTITFTILATLIGVSVVLACTSELFTRAEAPRRDHLLFDTGSVSPALQAELGSALEDWRACSPKKLDQLSGIEYWQAPRPIQATGGWVIEEVSIENWSTNCQARAAAAPPGGTTCGGTQAVTSITSGVIYINPDAPGSCDLGETLRHEIGHTLGLDHSSCSGYVMESPRTGSRSIQTVECNFVTQHWETFTEEEVQAWWDDPENECVILGECDPGSPLIVNLEGNSIHTTDLNSRSVVFDIDGDGVPERTAWISSTSSGSAFLWMDLNHNGAVDGAREFFGTASEIPNGGPSQANGFDVLALYDQPQNGGNGDGKIDSKDQIWASLWLWHDVNEDGVSDSAEISRVQRSKIIAFDLEYEALDEWDASLNKVIARGRLWVRGFRGTARPVPVEDIAFRFAELGGGSQ